jgi:integrase
MADSSSWTKSFGTQRGSRVRVYERAPGGMLYVSVWHPNQGERRLSLGHRDKVRAVREAKGLLKLRGPAPAVSGEPVPPLTLGALFDRYTREALYHPDGSLKTELYLRHVALTGSYLARYFGREQVVSDLTPDRIHEYVIWRREGGVAGTPVGVNTIQRDLGMFKAPLNWACHKYDSGRPLLMGHVLQKFRIPTEKDPKRPVIDEPSIKALLSTAQEVHPFLRTMILLAWKTGRRLSSILNLRWEDVDFEKGTIRWRAEHDKIRQTWVVPMHKAVRAELMQFRKKHPGIGSLLLFPHPQRRRHRSGPVTRHLAAWWLKEAFRRGKIEKPQGSLWHMFRRVWATERKDLPLKDVAAVGGWRDTSTLLRYQQPDARTMRAVVEFERPPEPSPAPEQAVSNSLSYSLTPRK